MPSKLPEASCTPSKESTEQIEKLKEYVESELKICDAQIAKSKAEIEEYVALKKRLNELPKKLSHDILVPFGSAGFMHGRLVNTNKVMVLLGDNYFVDMTCFQAGELIDRRIAYIQKTIAGFEEQKKLAASQIEFGDKLFKKDSNEVEIREPYDEEKEAALKTLRRETKTANRPKQPKVSANEFEEMMKRLDELGELESFENEDEMSDESHRITDHDDLTKVTTNDDARNLQSESIEDATKSRPRERTPSSDSSTAGTSDLDSDDIPTPEESQISSSEKASAETPNMERRRSVHFSDELTCFSPPPLTEGNTAENGSENAEQQKGDKFLKKSAKPEPVPRSILHNSGEKSPIDIDEMRRAQSPDRRIIPSSEKAFTGVVSERMPPKLCDQNEATEAKQDTLKASPKRISRFKMTRARDIR